VIVRVEFDALRAEGLFERVSFPGVHGAEALRRYAGRLIEIGRNTRAVMVATV